MRGRPLKVAQATDLSRRQVDHSPRLMISVHRLIYKREN